jgi:hypothetical protein
MGRLDGLFKTREKASLKLGCPDGHDGRPDGLGLHRFLSSRSPILARRVRRRPDGLRTELSGFSTEVLDCITSERQCAMCQENLNLLAHRLCAKKT